MGRLSLDMRTTSSRVSLVLMVTTVSSVLASTIVTSQYKTYGSSMYAGDVSTCTHSNILTSETERGSDVFSSCLATCSHYSDCGSFWLPSSGCLMVNTTKCSDTSNMRPAASNITYHVKIIL